MADLTFDIHGINTLKSLQQCEAALIALKLSMAPEQLKKQLSNICLEVSSNSTSVMKELATILKTMKKSSRLDFLVEQMNTSVEELQNDLKSLPGVSTPLPLPLPENSTPKLEANDDDSSNVAASVPVSVPLMEIIPLVTLTSLLIEITVRIKSTVKSVEKLADLAHFQPMTDEKLKKSDNNKNKNKVIEKDQHKEEDETMRTLQRVLLLALASQDCSLVLAMADSIVTSDKPSTSSPLDTPRIICHVCQKQFSQYTCPRCNSRYCSLHCYKSHSLRCTESFMRENVVAELQHLQPNDETKEKMLDILKKIHSEEETEDMDEQDSTLSEETINKIMSGDQISFDDLSSEEKKQFQRAIASGELSKLIEPWEPWWLRPSARTISLSREGTQLVQPVNEEETMTSPESSLESNQTEIPPGPDTPLPPLSNLSSTQPSPLLAVHLVDIIYSYCFTLRLYNGDWKSNAAESALVVLSVSSVLGQCAQPETVLEALSYCLEQTCSPAYRQIGGLQFGLGLIDDVVSLLTLGNNALLCLLSDLQRLVQTGEKELKAEKPQKTKKVEIRNKLKLAERKIYFIMCWVHEQPSEAWSSLAAIVRAEKASASAMEYVSVRRKLDKKTEQKSKVMIEEIE
ncbi:hypothetical protein G4B88_006524 [Cannabis sativa]|uniref:HIT-type domain-containing protein n=2 Tax=Cannabis sativa TaxID=3483 RepID=A0A7J6H2X6_CANSA|nr:hypothetical protein G4B88_006524 [Cannabis sativa]